MSNKNGGSKKSVLQKIRDLLGDRLKEDKNKGYMLDGKPINAIDLVKKFGTRV